MACKNFKELTHLLTNLNISRMEGNISIIISMIIMDGTVLG
jgi:hypothetical protein